MQITNVVTESKLMPPEQNKALALVLLVNGSHFVQQCRDDTSRGSVHRCDVVVTTHFT